MARVGINPARGKKSEYQPARVTVVVITYIPHQDGYFHDKLEVLQLSINSILKNTTQPYDVLILDNGSCPEAVDYLRNIYQDGLIDYLLLSAENIGKIGAFQLAFNTAPGEVIAYSDDDILFYPGWLEAQLEILDAYPDVGMVSGVPVRDASKRARKSLDKFLEANSSGLRIIEDHQFPDDWEVEWAKSTGRDPEVHLQQIKDRQETILELNGVKAFGSASHFQFVSPKHVLLEALPAEWSGKLMGNMIEFDEAVDAAGFLRLSTTDRYVQHIGNLLSDNVADTAADMGIESGVIRNKGTVKKHWLLYIPGSGRILRWIYNRLFRILHRVG